MRQLLINPVVHQTLEQILASDSVAGKFCRQPQDVVWAGLKSVREQLFSAENILSEHGHHYDQGTPIYDWNLHPPKLNSEERQLTVLDIGCGEGGLGRFLAAAGVKYVGIEPDPEFLQACNDKILSESDKIEYLPGALTDTGNEELIATLRHKLGDAKPDLYVVNSVLDHLPEPDRFLLALSSLVNTLNDFSPAPVLMTTLDPAFFSITPNASSLSTTKSTGEFFCALNADDEKYNLSISLPDRTERLLRSCGLHVLQYGRVPTTLLPWHFQDYLQNLRRLDIGESEVAPLYAPVMFWLVSPRCECPATVPASLTHLANVEYFSPLNIERIELRKSEVLECKANLASHVYFVEEGEMELRDGDERLISFGEDSWIGELEAIGDPIISRFPGQLVAVDNAKLVRIPIEMFNSIEISQDDTDAFISSQRPGVESLFHQYRLKSLGAIFGKSFIKISRPSLDLKSECGSLTDIGYGRTAEAARVYMVERCYLLRHLKAPLPSVYGIPTILRRRAVTETLGHTRANIKKEFRTAFSFITEVGIVDGFVMFEPNQSPGIELNDAERTTIGKLIVDEYGGETTIGPSHDGLAIVANPWSLFGMITADEKICPISNIVHATWLIDFYRAGKVAIDTGKAKKSWSTNDKHRRRAVNAGNCAGVLVMSRHRETQSIAVESEVMFYLSGRSQQYIGDLSVEHDEDGVKVVARRLIETVVTRQSYFLEAARNLLSDKS